MDELADIGARIRAARQQQARSLRSVARDLGVSASLLSQIETGKMRPSVRTLYQLVTELDLSLDELLGTGASSPTHRDRGSTDTTRVFTGRPVQHARDNQRLELTDGVVWERLADGGNPGLESLCVTYGPHAASSAAGTLSVHDGWEFAYVVEGRLQLFLEGGAPHDLGAGDSLSFDSNRPHRYANPTANSARAIFVISRESDAPIAPTAPRFAPDVVAPRSAQ